LAARRRDSRHATRRRVVGSCIVRVNARIRMDMVRGVANAIHITHHTPPARASAPPHIRHHPSTLSLKQHSQFPLYLHTQFHHGSAHTSLHGAVAMAPFSVATLSRFVTLCHAVMAPLPVARLEEESSRGGVLARGRRRRRRWELYHDHGMLPAAATALARRPLVADRASAAITQSCPWRPGPFPRHVRERKGSGTTAARSRPSHTESLLTPGRTPGWRRGFPSSLPARPRARA